ncbi:conserved hypothetical protein [Ricinus communis]|uniref:Cache domain-containing protein n=1 Tax=Ricinus communis TaxID=3988 RepID=B9TH62_RICCO|nr:conserved hypothetical protein [Ricinus communis]
MHVAMNGLVTDARRRTWPKNPLTLIPAVTVLLLCVLWTAVLYRLHVEKNAAIREARVSVDILAQSLATHTLKAIHDMDEIALLIKFGYESAPSQFNLDAYQAHGLISSGTALQVTLVGANGHVFKSTGKLSGDVDLSDREHVAIHRRRTDVGLFISRPVMGRVSGQWSVQGTRRIDRPDGGFGGVVVVSENPAWLTASFYNAAALGQHGLVAVLSPDGFPLSRQVGDVSGPMDNRPQPSYVASLRSGNDTVVDPLDHTQRIVAVRRLEPYGLIVVTGLSLAEALDDYVRMRHVYLAMSIVISVMLAGFATDAKRCNDSPRRIHSPGYPTAAG